MSRPARDRVGGGAMRAGSAKARMGGAAVRTGGRAARTAGHAAWTGGQAVQAGGQAVRTGGQAAVEVVALLPLVVAVALAILQALAAGLASELAAHAAHDGAVALAEGRDAAGAARAALPGWARSRVAVALRGRRVQVRVTPPALLPGLAARLAATATADAGEGG